MMYWNRDYARGIRDSKVHRPSRGNPRVRYAFVLVHRVKLADKQCRCASRESSQRRPETRSRIYEASNAAERAGATATAKKGSRGGGKGGKRRNGGNQRRKRGGGASDARSDGVGVHERRSRCGGEDRAGRRRRIARSRRATRSVVGVRCERMREPRVAATHARRRRDAVVARIERSAKWFRWQRAKAFGFTERRDEDDGFLVLPLCCDEIATIDQVIADL
ncbi:hypothetical protein Scep_026992 [Stephania cephalantha]|uniref:Uncharacterized protein n=1 Tax=Stephania cephalantha TaxID=152367 RepID=A0AAP0ERT9_9MAGN